MSAYPEHDKMKQVRDESQIIGEFLEWLGRSNTHLCEWDDNTERFYPDHTPINNRLAQYFGIDLDKIEQEKRAMIERLRNAA